MVERGGGGWDGVVGISSEIFFHHNPTKHIL